MFPLSTVRWPGLFHKATTRTIGLRAQQSQEQTMMFVLDTPQRLIRGSSLDNGLRPWYPAPHSRASDTGWRRRSADEGRNSFLSTALKSHMIRKCESALCASCATARTYTKLLAATSQYVRWEGSDDVGGVRNLEEQEHRGVLFV
ncbi:hypothetical protein MVEN_00534400 [Mycena venus]|uniref:Uncharacterized protein n=1 Tax=Mycena venus TaxID=2733690 RepID=A0A8H6YL67_9AGAR|nr:hypothetical protein MVEN_00534400 [Mycena venus]